MALVQSFVTSVEAHEAPVSSSGSVSEESDSMTSKVSLRGAVEY